MSRGIVVIALVIPGCLASKSIPCGDLDQVCPLGTVCDAAHKGCILQTQLDACATAADLAPCTYGTPGALGTCHEAVCLPSECGNGRRDVDYALAADGTRLEACDDGNRTSGDGCSADCRSTELCGNGIVDAVNYEECDPGDLRSHDGCSSKCKLEFSRWENLGAHPPRTYVPGAAFDSDRATMVVVGGSPPAGVTTGVDMVPVERIAGGWQRALALVLPAPRFDATLTFVPGVHASVLVGGEVAGPSREAWLWNGLVWTRGPDLPTARTRHAAAFDAAHGRLVVASGYRHIDVSDPSQLIFEVAPDTLVFDGTTWTSLAGPPGRADAHLAYDPIHQIVVLQGGQTIGPSGQSTVFADTWIFDGTTWTEAPAAGGPALEGGAMAFSAALGRLVLVGGIDDAGQFGADTWTFDATSRTWGKLASAAAAPFPPRAGFALVDDGHGALLSVGGSDINGAVTTDVRLDATGAWSDAGAPSPREGVLVTLETDPARVLVYGGDDGANLLGDTFEITDAGWQHRTATPPIDSSANPLFTQFGALAYDAAHHDAILFARDGVALPGVTWMWDGTAWSNVTPAGPSPDRRTGAVFAFDAARGSLLLFGGKNIIPQPPNPVGRTVDLADTWRWDGASKSWELLVTPTAPPARNGALAAYDPEWQRVVVFGGVITNKNTPVSDAAIWSWDGTAWSSTPALGDVPAVGTSGGMAWSAARHRLVAILDHDLSPQAFELGGEHHDTWTRIPTAAQAGLRVGGTIAPLLDGSGVGIVFGGDPSTGAMLDDLLAIRPSDPNTEDETCVAGHDIDGDGLAGCDDPDCSWTCP